MLIPVEQSGVRLPEETYPENNDRKLSKFERYLTFWVGLTIVVGTLISVAVPRAAVILNDWTFHQVSIPVALCLFFIIFPIMVKIDFSKVKAAARSPKPIVLTLVINWLVKPFTMYSIAYFFLAVLFKELIDGTELINGVEVSIYRSYISGAILLGIAPCTAMVLMWGYLARGNDALTLVMVGINSLLMLILYAPLGKLLLSINQMPIPWQTIILSVGVYVGLPLVSGYYSRRWLLRHKGIDYFNRVFLPRLAPVSTIALLATLVILFALKGDVILSHPIHILLIAIPLFIQTILIFSISFIAAKFMKLSYEDAAPAAMIGASNHFEVAIATAVVLFGLNSGAAMATVVGVLIEVPLMLMLVRFCLKRRIWFRIANG